MSTSTRIAVLDDEPDILRLVSLHLEKAGFSVDGFTSSKKFLQSLDLRKPELVILDLMLPDADGFDILSLIRGDVRLSGVPVIMLTARDREADKVRGLELGADDYVTKPFSPRELTARVKAVLRRTGSGPSGTIAINGVLTIDPERFEVKAGQESVLLTPVEFRILHLLASQPGKVFTREKILNHLWGNEKAVLDRTVDVHIKNLRDKLGDAGRLITNVRGIGYRIDA